MAMAKKKRNRRKIKILTVENERKVVRHGLTMMGFLSIFGCIVLLSWVAAKISDPETLPVRGVKVEGDFKYLHTESLERLVAEKVNGGFFTVNVDQIRASVLSAPWVREVTVRKLWPDTLYVKISEQKAVVRWGETGFLNEKGELFEPEETMHPEGLIRLSGPRGTEQQVYKKYESLLRLLSDHNRQIVWLKLNERWGWSFGLNGGPAVIVGKKEVDERILRYTNEVEKNFGHDIEHIAQVDLRYTNGFTLRKKIESQEVETLTDMNTKNEIRGT